MAIFLRRTTMAEAAAEAALRFLTTYLALLVAIISSGKAASAPALAGAL